jgi:serine/threonine-protein kinase
MGQDPSGGSQSEVGSEVTITVGTGPSSVPVPRLYGNTPAQAESVLQGAGLRLGAQSQDYSDDVAEGGIFLQDPSGGENVEPGTAVDVTVSLGPEQVEVPEVYGLSVAAAQTTLSEAGLNSTPIEVEGDEAAGTALSTDPAVGAMVDPGSTVSLFYSAGPPPVTTASPDASASPAAEAKPEAAPTSDQGPQVERNTDARAAPERQPPVRPQREDRPQDNSGPSNSAQDNSGPDDSTQTNNTQDKSTQTNNTQDKSTQSSSGTGNGGQQDTAPGAQQSPKPGKEK